MSREKKYRLNEVKDNRNTPLDATNCFQSIFLTYPNKIVEDGNKFPYQEKMLYKLGEEYDMETESKKLKIYMDKILAKKKNFSFWDIFNFGGSDLKWACGLELLANLLQISSPVLLKSFITWILTPNADKNEGYFLIGIYFLLSLLRTYLAHWAQGILARGKQRRKNALQGYILNSLLRLPPSARRYFDAGKVTVYLTSDLSRLAIANQYANAFIVTPTMSLIYFVLIILELGWVGLIAPILILFSLYLQNSLQNKVLGPLFLKSATISDKTSKNVEEMIRGAKATKFNAWEGIIYDKLDLLRKNMKNILERVSTLRGLLSSVSELTPSIIAIICLTVYQAFVEDLTVGKSYSVLLLLNLLVIPFTIYIYSFTMVIHSKIAGERLTDLFKISEFNQTKNDIKLEKGTVRIEYGYFTWESEFDTKKKEEDSKKTKDTIVDTLKEINIEFFSGEFSAIIGKVGSGKTSLLLSLMNEMNKTEGKVRKNGTFAYIGQEAFLLNETLKNNILFGLEYDHGRYQHVLDICQLRSDIAMLPGGDETEIGENGINLSGGQKQRVSIARAVYSDRDIYIIDDCLSALDAYVGKAILEGVFKEHLKGKTRIMVTHHLHFLDQMKKVVLLENGKIIQSGPFERLKETKAYKEFSTTVKKQLEIEEEQKKKIEKEKIVEEIEKPESSIGFLDKDSTYKPIVEKIVIKRIKNPENKKLLENELRINKEKQERGKLIVKETRFTGVVGWDVYKWFMSKGGFCPIFFFLLFAFLSVIIKMIGSWWIGQWSFNSFNLSSGSYAWIYFGITILFFITFSLRSYLYAIYSATIGYNIFKKMIWNILRRPIEFFETTKIGQILNVTTKDIEEIDFKIPYIFNFMIDGVFGMLGTLLIAALITPFVSLIILLSVILFIGSAQKYTRSSTEIKRLNQLANTPFLSKVSELINGQVEVEVYGVKSMFLEQLKSFNNKLISMELHESYTTLWLSLRLELYVSLIVLISGGFIAVSKNINLNLTKDGPTLALVATYLFTLTARVNMVIFSYGEIAKGFSAAQRAKEYSDNKVFEDEFEKANERLNYNWPNRGNVQLVNVSAKYRKGLPLVLNKINLKILSNQKIGIVGRTGSGKSTLILCLMRILELAETDEEENPIQKGKILIDDVDISKIGLHDLRKKLAIIPQEPYLIKGTLKFNVDPSENYSDDDIIKALKECQLWDTLTDETIRSQKLKDYELKQYGEEGLLLKKYGIPAKKLTTDEEDETVLRKIKIGKITDDDKLNLKLEGKGQNLSVGQRQLVCIARALVKKPKILLMDEATANIDQKTDSIIQDLIKNHLQNTTVVTIAHRLLTIIQYDRLIVLKDGKKIEEGTPLELIFSGGYFCSLVDEGGEEFRKRMIYLAKNRSVDPASVK